MRVKLFAGDAGEFHHYVVRQVNNLGVFFKYFGLLNALSICSYFFPTNHWLLV